MENDQLLLQDGPLAPPHHFEGMPDQPHTCTVQLIAITGRETTNPVETNFELPRLTADEPLATKAVYAPLTCVAFFGGLFVAWRFATWTRYAPSDVCLETPPSSVELGPHIWPGLHGFPFYYQCSYLDDATGLWRNTTQGWEFNWIALGAVLALIIASVFFVRDRRLSRARKVTPAP